MAHMSRIQPSRQSLSQPGNLFGRLFPQLPPWQPKNISGEVEEYLKSLFNGTKFMMEPEDESGDSDIPAGYTYFGQFIDHDITFDPASELMRQTDPAGVRNHRTPALDLDSVYGSGREVMPYLYRKTEKTKKTEKTEKTEKLWIGIEGDSLLDLPRNEDGVAIIGDPRNDENAIVSQLHLAFMRAHNALVDEAQGQKYADPYQAARQSLRWLYQYIVWHDFVKRIASEAIWKQALEKRGGQGRPVYWHGGLDHIYRVDCPPFMPIEFAAAAYRFGHSMVRPSYRTNGDNDIPLFSENGDDLRGRKRLTVERELDWKLFLDLETDTPENNNKARKIDTKLSAPLFGLPEEDPKNLALRNLQRGVDMGLPSGTSVARHLGFKPLDLGKGDLDALWYYILKEAEEQGGGNRLGEVGSTIVCATFAGLLLKDPNSWINQQPNWEPSKIELFPKNTQEVPKSTQEALKGELSDILRIAGLISTDTKATRKKTAGKKKAAKKKQPARKG